MCVHVCMNCSIFINSICFKCPYISKSLIRLHKNLEKAHTSRSNTGFLCCGWIKYNCMIGKSFVHTWYPIADWVDWLTHLLGNGLRDCVVPGGIFTSLVIVCYRIIWERRLFASTNGRWNYRTKTLQSKSPHLEWSYNEPWNWKAKRLVGVKCM